MEAHAKDVMLLWELSRAQDTLRKHFVSLHAILSGETIFSMGTAKVKDTPFSSLPRVDFPPPAENKCRKLYK